MKLSFIKYYIVDALKPFFPAVELGKIAEKDLIVVDIENDNAEKNKNCKCLNACIKCKCGKQR